jgi:acyl-CoA thioester hydrolase
MSNSTTRLQSVCPADLDEGAAELLIAARSVVYPWQCDHMGHMNVMWYTGKFDEATWHLLSQIGITPSYLRNNKRGMVAVQQEITYKRELLAGDLITIRSGVLEIRDKVIRLYHEMLNAETQEVAAATTITGVHLDTVTRKSCPFPAEILECGRRSIVQASRP